MIYLADEVHLEIIDLVRDPSAAERDLHAELNIAVELVALPAPPELVGHVVGAASTGTTTAYVVYDLAGRSERIVMPREIDGTLIIQYGRRARADERYEVNVTSPVCEELWEMSPHQALRRLADLADHIRYDTIDSDYDYTSNVAPAAVDPDYQLIDVVFLSGNELLVVYSAHLDALGTDRPNCGWSAAATASR